MMLEACSTDHSDAKSSVFFNLYGKCLVCLMSGV